MDYPICQYHQGDWLIPYGKTEPDRVREISYQEEMAGIWCILTFRHDRNVYHYPGYCTPILITGEMLEKNGFTYCDGAYYLCAQNDDGEEIEVSIFHVGCEWSSNQLHIKYDDDPSDNHIIHLIGCNYVHELQHAFELVKIKADIVL